MKEPMSEWDKKLKEFYELSYEERLEYWIEKRFYIIHHCKFNSDLAIERNPNLKEKIVGKNGEFSIVPETNEQQEQYLYFIISYLPYITLTPEDYYKSKGLKELILELDSRIAEADKPSFLLNNELKEIEENLENAYQIGVKGSDLRSGYEDSATGKLRHYFNFNSEVTPDYFYFYGALLSKYEKYIRERVIDFDPSAPNRNSVTTLNFTSINLLVKIMQECNLFPENTSQTKMDNFLSQLINENPKSIEQGRKNIPSLMLGKITVPQKRQYLPSLLKIRPILNDLGNMELLKKYEEIIKRIENIK